MNTWTTSESENKMKLKDKIMNYIEHHLSGAVFICFIIFELDCIFGI